MTAFEPVLLRDPSSGLTATFVPGAGMIGTSLCDDGVELLGQRRGLAAYVSAHKTMGIPLLYPWANRLSGNEIGRASCREGMKRRAARVSERERDEAADEK